MRFSSVWDAGISPLSHNIDMTLRFHKAIRDLHPLLAEMAPKGNKSGYTAMLKTPSIHDMDETQWHKLFRQNGDYFPDGRVDAYGVHIEFWNRNATEDDTIIFNARYNAADLNAMGFNFPAAITAPEVPMAILKAEIEGFGAHKGQIYSPRHSEPLDTPIWLLWIKDGVPWEVAIENYRLDPAQGPHTSAEPWLGGTLYTWPDYEPWRFLPQPRWPWGN
jgi:hypothetical protein